MKRHLGFFPVSDIRLYAAELVRLIYPCWSRRTNRHFSQLLGLEALHGMPAIHRDLKPDNVLVSPAGHLVITDYGLSKRFPGYVGNPPYIDFVGTKGYMPPEMLDNYNPKTQRLNGPQNGFAADIWSLGVVILELFAGRRHGFFSPGNRFWEVRANAFESWVFDADAGQLLVEVSPLLQLLVLF